MNKYCQKCFTIHFPQVVEDLLNPPQNGNATPNSTSSSSAHNSDSEDSQPPDQCGLPGTALAILDANRQSHTPTDSPQKDTTPEKDKVPESDQMFVEDEMNKGSKLDE